MADSHRQIEIVETGAEDSPSLAPKGINSSEGKKNDVVSKSGSAVTFVRPKTEPTRLACLRATQCWMSEIHACCSRRGAALRQQSGSTVGRGQYRNAVASGESRNCKNTLVNEAQGRPDATALRY